MNIGIVGCGIVGGATIEGFKNAHKIFTYDKFKPGYGTLKEIADNCQIIFITVPTPMRKSGQIDLSAIYDAVSILNEYAVFEDKEEDKQIIVIRSTAVSGTTDTLAERYRKFNFAFNPEFLTEKNATEDFLKSSRIVIGANKDFIVKKIERVYREAGFKCDTIFTDIKTAEMVKYCSNVFLASQVSVANELYEVCRILNIDWEIIRHALSFDKRIGSFTMVPGSDNERGFSGACFPKDLNALIYLAREHGYRPDLLEEVWRTNKKFRTEIDWL